MAYDFAARHDRLRVRMREVNSREVLYVRGDVEFTWRATVYELKPEDATTFGIVLTARRRDYIGDSAKLVEQFGLPIQGDQIIDGEIECLVIPLASELPVFTWTNHQRNEFRIHSEVTATGCR